MSGSLPLFDWSRNLDEPTGQAGSGEAATPWTVSGLNRAIKQTLEADFSDIELIGEISGLSKPRSGHLYFNLKDERTTLRAVLWKSAASKVKFELKDGLSVRVKGDVTVYEPRGEYQIQIKKVEPEGIGALELAFRQLQERLGAEGLFDPARKRSLPRFPQRIIVITSPTGAAVRDFLQVATRRWRAVEILIAPVKVQGIGAAEQIVEAIGTANRVAGADMVVLTRGGGSLEDLWPFNEEAVARAIVASRLPVVSAVGHEIDLTIADLAADFRALTPSEAGERIVPESEEVRAFLNHQADRLTRALTETATRGRLRLERQADRLARTMSATVSRGRLRLERQADRLNAAGRDRIQCLGTELEALADRARLALIAGLDRRQHDLARYAAQLNALSPLNVLARGYSLTQNTDGAILRDASSVGPDDVIRTRLARGTVLSRVVQVIPGGEAPPPECAPETTGAPRPRSSRR